ncbi:hypothetical protein LXL04_012936 [Taraxacum kok-saghyz]
MNGARVLTGFGSGDPGREIKFEPSVTCERLDKTTSFGSREIDDGDIICFQKLSQARAVDKYRYPDVPSFLEYVKNHQIVHFRSLDRPKEDDFCLELSKLHTYDDVTERVVGQIGADDPSKLRLTPHNCYSQQPQRDPFEFRDAEHLLDMLVCCNQASDILYYEVLDIPLPELQCLKTLKVAFHHSTKEEVETVRPIIHNIRLPKQSIVGDVLKKIKTKVDLSHPDAELRLLELFFHKIYKVLTIVLDRYCFSFLVCTFSNRLILPLTQKIETIKDHYWTLRAEEFPVVYEIPEEEKNLGPQDQLIHVYHFTKESAQNQMQVKNFGEPFFLVIYENETLAAVKVRIQKKLEVSDDEFSEFAFLSFGRPEYLQDSDIVSSRFQKKYVYGGAWEQYLEATPRYSIANRLARDAIASIDSEGCGASMDGSETRSNRRNKEGSVPDQQKEAGKKSAAKSSFITPPPQSRTVLGFGGGAAAALHAIRTGEGEKDSFDSRKACNMADLDVGGGEGSSSAILKREKMRKRFHNVPEDDDDFVLRCHGSYISKGPGENLSCNDLQLEYVKPVIDDANGSVMIPSDVVNRGSIPYSRTLYGFFIEEKEIDFDLVNSHFRKMWKTHGVEDIMVNDNGFYFFKFKTDEGMLQALEHGPWTISNTNSPIFLKRWSPGLILEKSKHDKLKLPVWIRTYGMPLELWNKNGMNIIASILGNPLAVDSCTAWMCINASGRAGYARVLVDFEATGNWPDEIAVSVPYGNGHSLSTLRIKYSWKPDKCSFCKVFDHTDSNCTHQKVMANDKNIPLPELQCLKTLKITFHHSTKEEVGTVTISVLPVIHNISLPKQSSVGDVVNEIKTKVELSHPNAELRLLEVFYHKIYRVLTIVLDQHCFFLSTYSNCLLLPLQTFPLTEKIDNINDRYLTLRAEEIPEEEKNLGPQDQLIHVYHFTKEAAQNQMPVKNFGDPFFLLIHEKETLAVVKVRIQKKLEVPDDEFCKWKFALVSLMRIKYLQDSDLVSSWIQKRDVNSASEQCLGLEHPP